MGYLALYRLWRPQTFRDVVGQEHVCITLRNAVRLQRVAHAYLFSGPRGTGKTSMAKILSKALNCRNLSEGEPCGSCAPCKQIAAGSFIDVQEIDAASNRGIDEMRDLRDKVNYLPAAGSYKVYIIDEVHMLTNEAFNALLKTLEEPPAHVVFVLATTDAGKVPATVLSRCQRFDFRLLTVDQMMNRMEMVCRESGWLVEKEALLSLAQAAGGGLRDCFSLLEQAASYGEGKITSGVVHQFLGMAGPGLIKSLIKAMLAGDAGQMITAVDEAIQRGIEAGALLQEIVLRLRDFVEVLVAREGGKDPRAGLDEGQEDLTVLVGNNGLGRIVEILDELHRLSIDLRWIPYPRVALETVLLKLTTQKAKAALEERVTQLEERLGQIVHGETAAAIIPLEVSEGSSETSKLERKIEKTGVSHGVSHGRAKDDTIMMQKELSEAVASGEGDIEGALSLEKVLNLWPGILDKVRRSKGGVYTHALLVDGKPVELRGQQLTVQFKTAFHKDGMEQARSREMVQQVLYQTLKQEIRLKFTLVAETREPDIMVNQLDDPVVKAAMEMFGAELVEIKNRGEGVRKNGHGKHQQDAETGAEDAGGTGQDTGRGGAKNP